jgi:hypothetical protein
LLADRIMPEMFMLVVYWAHTETLLFFGMWRRVVWWNVIVLKQDGVSIFRVAESSNLKLSICLRNFTVTTAAPYIARAKLIEPCTTWETNVTLLRHILTTSVWTQRLLHAPLSLTLELHFAHNTDVNFFRMIVKRTVGFLASGVTVCPVMKKLILIS